MAVMKELLHFMSVSVGSGSFSKECAFFRLEWHLFLAL